MAYARIQEIEDQINKVWTDMKGCVQKFENMSKGNGVAVLQRFSTIVWRKMLSSRLQFEAAGCLGREKHNPPVCGFS